MAVRPRASARFMGAAYRLRSSLAQQLDGIAHLDRPRAAHEDVLAEHDLPAPAAEVGERAQWLAVRVLHPRERIHRGEGTAGAGLDDLQHSLSHPQALPAVLGEGLATLHH